MIDVCATWLLGSSGKILAKENQLIQLVGVKGHDLFPGESHEKMM